MIRLLSLARFGAAAVLILLAGAAAADDEARPYCTEDAMIVFDASGSMAGNTVQGLFSDVTRIDEDGASVDAPTKLSR